MSDAGTPPPPPPVNPYGATPGPGGTPPNNNLVAAILATLFCCLPFGIVAIIKAAEVNGKWAAGDVAGAQNSADEAMKWVKWSVAGFAALMVLYVIGFTVFFSTVGAIEQTTFP